VSNPCAHCAGPVPTIDNTKWRQFWGAVHVTETTTTTRTARIAMTQITSPTGNRADDKVLRSQGDFDLCSDCWVELSRWLGVGRRR